jgi:arylsulfatase A-like enzyme
MDIYPTLAELCGLTPPAYLDGRSLAPLLKDPKAPWESTAITGLCDKSKADLAYISIRHELGRYTRYGSDEEEFYDTTKDPHEWTNQIDRPEYADTVKKLRAMVPGSDDAAPPLPSALAEKGRESQPEKKKKKKTEGSK